jgi:hypothetical protein
VTGGHITAVILIGLYLIAIARLVSWRIAANATRERLRDIAAERDLLAGDVNQVRFFHSTYVTQEGQHDRV